MSGQRGQRMSGLPVQHIRSATGRALCGARPRKWGALFASRPADSDCRQCWGRYRPPELQAATGPPPAPLTDEQRAELAELRAALPAAVTRRRAGEAA